MVPKGVEAKRKGNILQVISYRARSETGGLKWMTRRTVKIPYLIVSPVWPACHLSAGTKN